MSPVYESGVADASHDFEPVSQVEQGSNSPPHTGARFRRSNVPQIVPLEPEANAGGSFGWGHRHHHGPQGNEFPDPPLPPLPPHPPTPPYFAHSGPFGPGFGYWVNDTIRDATQQFTDAIFGPPHGPPGSPHRGPGSRRGPHHPPPHPHHGPPPHFPWGGPHGRGPRWGHHHCGNELIHPPLDIFSSEDSYIVNIELPGLKKKDVDISVNERLLTISGEFTTTPSDGGDGGDGSGDEFIDLDDKGHCGDDKKKGFVRRERRFGKFKRTLRLPPWVNTEDIKASMAEGVLTITVKKKKEDEPSSARKINIL